VEFLIQAGIEIADELSIGDHPELK